MKLDELFNTKKLIEDVGIFNPQSPDFAPRDIHDVRRPTLTLKHLNSLKKIKNRRFRELLQKEKFLGVMYGLPEADSRPEF